MKNLWRLLRLLCLMRAASVWQYCVAFCFFWLSYCGYQFVVIDRLSASFFEVLSMAALWFFYIKILLFTVIGLRKNHNVYFIDALKSTSWVVGVCAGLAALVSTYIMAIQFLSFIQINIVMSFAMAMSGFLYRKPTPLRDVLVPQFGVISCLMLLNIYMLLQRDELFNIVSTFYVCTALLIFFFSIYASVTSYGRWMQHAANEQFDAKLRTWMAPQ